MTDSFDPQNDFDAFYYAMGCGSSYDRRGHWLGFFQGMADQIIADLHPKNVLDAGCAKGFLVEGLRNRGVEAWGIDISEYAIQEVFDPIKPYCKVGSITDPFPQKYDLIVTIEVVEHMAAEMGKKAIANMCAHTDRVLFHRPPLITKKQLILTSNHPNTGQGNLPVMVSSEMWILMPVLLLPGLYVLRRLTYRYIN